MTAEQIRELTNEGWKTLGTMMLTEHLLVATNASADKIHEQRQFIEQYRKVLEKQTNLALLPERNT